MSPNNVLGFQKVWYLFIKNKLLLIMKGEGSGSQLQYSCLENPMDGGAWWAAVHGVAKSRTRLSDFNLIFHFPALEKEMATHSSVLTWRIPGMGEPPGLPSMGSHRVGHNWSDLAAAAIMKKPFVVLMEDRQCINSIFNFCLYIIIYKMFLESI